MKEIYGRSYGIPSGPFRDLEERRISGDEYAKRVRREIRERVRETPAPSQPRRPEKDDGDRADQ
jgi:hypothetical protein